MKKKLMAVMMFVLGALVMVVFQQIGQTAPALTALDYAEIDQLYARYAFAADTGEAEMLARVFTEDGVFDVTNALSGEPLAPGQWVPVQGYEQLKVSRRAAAANPLKTPRHYTTNILIEPTAEGAMGAAYTFDGSSERTGTYDDQLVKTPEGWRFKKRTATFGTFSDELLQALA